MLCAGFQATVIPHKALCCKVMHFSIRIDHAYKACPEMDVPSSLITALTCIASTSSSILVASFSCFPGCTCRQLLREHVGLLTDGKRELIRSLLDMISTPLTLSWESASGGGTGRLSEPNTPYRGCQSTAVVGSIATSLALSQA